MNGAVVKSTGEEESSIQVGNLAFIIYILISINHEKELSVISHTQLYLLIIP